MKSLFTSKTFWIAILQAVAGILAQLYPDPTVNAVGGVAIAKSVVDIALRLVTNTGVTLG